MKKRISKRSIKKAERILIEQIGRVVEPLGCQVIGLGPDAVGVQGDARTYGRAAIITIPTEADHVQISEISTILTNRVSGITRVLMDIPIPKYQDDAQVDQPV